MGRCFGIGPLALTGSQPEQGNRESDMQTEEKQDPPGVQTSPPGVETKPPGEQVKPERHWHLVDIKEGVEGPGLVILGEPKEIADLVRRAVRVCYRQSKRELDKLQEQGDPARVGAAYLRWQELDKLDGALDPGLFNRDHNGDFLVEAIEDTLDAIGIVEVTERVSMKIFFCEEQCPGLTEHQEEEREEEKRRGRHGHAHGKAFVLPFDPGDGPVNMADLLSSARVDLEDMFEAAGIRVAKTEPDLSDPATTEAYINAQRPTLTDTE